ncbi:MAG TPA: MFS transporter [Candidatus Limnocylindrales bacterium]|nr:MFS transporter [Candidatus Limnocylindrales bacterium]
MSPRTWTLIAVVLGSGIVFLDSTIVNVALRAIGDQLPATILGVLEGQSYIVNGYLLTLSALLILAGALADRYGRRRMFIIGLAGFGVSSLVCGLAPSMELLIVARLVQGAFGALLVPTSLALINANFDGAERGRAFGVWAAATSALVVLGPPIGGFLVDTIGWEVAFLVNVPLCALGVAIAATRLEESRNPDAPDRFDWLGAAAVALAVGGLAYGAIRGQEQQWTDPTAWAALAVGAVATVALVPLMAFRRNVLVPPSLFRSRNFTVVNISTLVIYGALYMYSYFQAIFVQQALGYTATAAGLTGLPIGLALVFFSTRVGALAGRYGPRRFMAIGPIFMALGLFWYVRLPPDSARWTASFADPATLVPPVSYLVDILPAVLLFAVGISILVAPLTTALMTSVPIGNSGLASAINNAISRIGPVLAGAVVFIAVSASFYAGVEERLPGIDTSSPEVRAELRPLRLPTDVPPQTERAALEASTDAFRLAMLIAGLLCAIGAAANWVGIRDEQAADNPPPVEPVAAA